MVRVRSLSCLVVFAVLVLPAGLARARPTSTPHTGGLFLLVTLPGGAQGDSVQARVEVVNCSYEVKRFREPLGAASFHYEWFASSGESLGFGGSNSGAEQSPKGTAVLGIGERWASLYRVARFPRSTENGAVLRATLTIEAAEGETQRISGQAVVGKTAPDPCPPRER